MKNIEKYPREAKAMVKVERRENPLGKGWAFNNFHGNLLEAGVGGIISQIQSIEWEECII